MADRSALDTTEEPSVFGGGAAWDNGAVRYTAVGGLWASAIVTGFAAAAAWSFPAGAFPVATLGCGLAIFGFASGRRFVPAALLVVHLALFTHSAMEIWR